MPEGTCSISWCTAPAYCRGWCHPHYDCWYRTGDPLTPPKTRRNGDVLAELRQAAVADTDECVIFAGHKNRPNVSYNGRQMFASRAVWWIANGNPGRLSVLHTCHRGDVGCINIRHLYRGTQKQNIRDMDRAGRRVRGLTGVLTEAQVLEIRRRHVRGVNQHQRSNTAALAAEFGIARNTVTCIVAGRRWRSTSDEPVDHFTAELERAAEAAGEDAGEFDGVEAAEAGAAAGAEG